MLLTLLPPECNQAAALAWVDLLSVRTSLVQSFRRPDLGGSPRRAAPASATPAADPELAGPHSQRERDARMLSLIHSDLLWVALAFVLSMAGMLATYPE
jgi:hypothetical protein